MQEQSAGWNRTKAVADSSDHRDALEVLDNMAASMEDTAGVWADNVMEGFQTENAEVANSEQNNAARRIQMLDGLTDDMKKDIVMNEQTDAVLQDQDEHDEFQALEAIRLKRIAGQPAGGGRPKKSRMAVAALATRSLFVCLLVCLFVCLFILMRAGQ